jgi:hypothetical protein
MRLLGCDPGSHTGLVLVELPAGTWDLLGARVLYRGTLAASDGEGRDRRTLERMRERLRLLRPHVAVLEDPSDAATYWGQSRRGKPVQRGSAYRLGVYKGLLYAALLEATEAIVEYRVQGTAADPGWMRDHGTRAVALARMQALARQLGLADQLTEHEAMALGVIAHHCRKMQLRSLTQALATRSVP